MFKHASFVQPNTLSISNPIAYRRVDISSGLMTAADRYVDALDILGHVPTSSTLTAN